MNTHYEFSVPQLRRGFGILSAYLAAAKRHVEATGLPESDVLQARLAPDMLSFTAQFQRASDKAKNGVARLAQVEAPGFADVEQSFAELEQRIRGTLDFIDLVDPAKFEAAGQRQVELRFRSISGSMTGHTYLTQVLMPDFYFHVATAHAILRNLGVAIGKADYLGKPDYLA